MAGRQPLSQPHPSHPGALTSLGSGRRRPGRGSVPPGWARRGRAGGKDCRAAAAAAGPGSGGGVVRRPCARAPAPARPRAAPPPGGGGGGGGSRRPGQGAASRRAPQGHGSPVGNAEGPRGFFSTCSFRGSCGEGLWGAGGPFAPVRAQHACVV